jgi:hypothetical protein
MSAVTAARDAQPAIQSLLRHKDYLGLWGDFSPTLVNALSSSVQELLISSIVHYVLCDLAAR